MNRLLTILAWLCILVIFPSARTAAQNNLPGTSGPRIDAESDQLTLFTEANKRYRDEDYRGAAEEYGRLILSGLRNGAMYYNLGNCYFKLGMLGKPSSATGWQRSISPGTRTLKPISRMRGR